MRKFTWAIPVSLCGLRMQGTRAGPYVIRIENRQVAFGPGWRWAGEGPAHDVAQPDSDAHARWMRMHASSSRSVASA